MMRKLPDLVARLFHALVNFLLDIEASALAAAPLPAYPPLCICVLLPAPFRLLSKVCGRASCIRCGFGEDEVQPGCC
jgi:hypothetical protein